MARIKDVAEHAGVSTATVSHVINGTRPVSRELTERVLASMEALGYKRDAIARSLRRRETLTLGLILPSAEIPFFAAVTRSIEEAAYNSGYSVILCNTDWNLSRELHYLENLLARQVDGLFLISARMTAEHVAPVVDAGTPVVMFERQMPGIPLDAVCINNYDSAYQVVDHLIGLGHRRIGFVCGLGASNLLSNTRLQGCEQALRDHGLELIEASICRGDYLPESGRVAARQLMALPDPPSAIFCFNDLMALGALQGLQEQGTRVPEEVAVVGFDGISLTEHTSPPLTTVRQPIKGMGQVAVDLLLKRIRGKDQFEPQLVVLETELVARTSTIGDGQYHPIGNDLSSDLS